MEQTPQWVSLTQASDILGYSEDFVRRLVYRGMVACESGFPFPKMVSYADVMKIKPACDAARDIVARGGAPSADSIFDTLQRARYLYV